MLELIRPLRLVTGLHLLHEVGQRRRKGSGARPFPGGEFEDEQGVGVELDQIAAKDGRHVLYEHCGGAVDPVWRDEDVDAA